MIRNLKLKLIKLFLIINDLIINEILNLFNNNVYDINYYYNKCIRNKINIQLNFYVKNNLNVNICNLF